MNRQTLRILLEAVAVTLCLSIIVGQQSEAKITSTATAPTFHNAFNRGTTLWLGQAATTSEGKGSATHFDSDGVVEQ
ncbi:hypothetical protein H6F96_19895 [Microcoleus sp. FACHB-53]|jgi:pyruvate/2-oxoacid:ferredoxin oxidoreductase beta subunit|nr:hypothetical protein [Microcoleus sp. FACHB-53]MBD2129127.1 hypothetical protein [Microcoleus sp. FACHB-1]